jgi:predicted esterase
LLLASFIVLAANSTAARADTWNFDFGSPGIASPASSYNNITNKNLHTLGGLINSSGQATSVSFSVTSKFNTSGTANDGTYTTQVPFVGAATRDNFFGNVGTVNSVVAPNARIQFSGLDQNYLYDFIIYSGRLNQTVNLDTQYSIAGANSSVVNLNPANNTTQTANATGIRPNSSGVITIDLQPGAANTHPQKVYSLGALRMVSYPAQLPPPPPNPIPVSASYQLSNGANSIELGAHVDGDGKVHYAIFNNDPGVLTAAQVKTFASQSIAGSLVARGTVSRADAGSLAISAAGLPDKLIYSVYAVAESGSGILNDDSAVKRYLSVLPRKVSMQQYASGVMNKSGGTGDLVRYYVYYPPGYYDNPSQQYPMALYHGGGGENFSNSNNSESYFLSGHYRMNKTPLVARINLGQEMPFVVITPQCNNSLWTCTSATPYLAEVVDRSLSRYRVDPKRVHAIGMSNGGILVWATAYDYPTKFASIVPMASKMVRSLTSANLCARFSGANKTRVWHHHNAIDGYYTVDSARTAVNVIRACAGGVDARLTVYDGNTYPASVDPYRHATAEYVLNAPYVDYSINPAVLSSTLVPLAPELVGDLSQAENELRVSLGNASLNLDSMYDWLLLWTKP